MMSDKKSLSSEEISAIVDGFDPIDSVQMELHAQLPPGRRIVPMLQASEMVRAGLRGTFRKKFPELSLPELNMKILDYLTYIDKQHEHA